jgi:hypothetical protein
VITVPPRHRKHQTSYDRLTSCSSSTPDRYPPVLNLNAPEHTPPGNDWLTDSPIVTRFATEMVGLSTPDPLAAQWLIRVFLALWYWPLKDADAEDHMVRRFLGPPYTVDPNSVAQAPPA